MKKVKEFFKEHKEEIKGEALRIGYLAGGMALGYAVGKTIRSAEFACGINRMIAKNPQLETMMLDTLAEMGRS